MASTNVFSMWSRHNVTELYLKFDFSVIHMELVLACFEKTRNSVKINPCFEFLIPEITGFSFSCIFFWRFVDIIIQELIRTHVSIVICGKLFYFRKILSKIGNFCNFLLLFSLCTPWKKFPKKCNLTYS